jgi:hypothetical protein
MPWPSAALGDFEFQFAFVHEGDGGGFDAEQVDDAGEEQAQDFVEVKGGGDGAGGFDQGGHDLGLLAAFLVEAGVVDGDGGLVGDGAEQGEVAFAEEAGAGVDEGEDADDLVVPEEGHGEDGFGAFEGRVWDFEPALVLFGVGEQDGLLGAAHPAGEAALGVLGELAAGVADEAAVVEQPAVRDFAVGVEDEQAGADGADALGGEADDVGEEVGEVEAADDFAADVVEEFEPGILACGCEGQVFHHVRGSIA